MLVLTRKLGETVRIGEDVEVYVIGVNRGRVKLGFRAPRDIAVQRGEVADHRADHSDHSDHELSLAQLDDPTPSPSLAQSQRGIANSTVCAPLRMFRRLREI